jgi:excinuclease UvrABC nuclease subunit
MDFNISGIYTFLSKEQEILYVGKTVKLLNRIRQHLTDEKEWKKDIPFFI